MFSGDVLEVKVLGILAMVDDGETDWKVIGGLPPCNLSRNVCFVFEGIQSLDCNSLQ